MNVVYFGHPINVYDTTLETWLLEAITQKFTPKMIGKLEICNPNTPEHDKGYSARRTLTGSGMDYFYEEVLPKCTTGVFLPFKDGRWAAGVFGEARWFQQQGLPVWRITESGEIVPTDTLLVSSAGLVLTVKETRERIRDEQGMITPY